MENELKPCPFCGGQAECRVQTGQESGHYILCHRCYAKSCASLTNCSAIYAWNLRTEPEPKPAESQPLVVTHNHIAGRTFWDWLVERQKFVWKDEFFPLILVAMFLLVLSFVLLLIAFAGN